MILLDGAFRANKVYNDYKNNKDWQRSLSTELASFGASTFAGIITASSVTTALSSFLMLTPYGWVVALGVGLGAGFLMIRRPPRSTPLYSSAASDVYKRQQSDNAQLSY